MKGVTASPALFRFFIKYLNGDLREAVSEAREPCVATTVDPGKRFADDVILIGRSEEELQLLLNACKNWARRNRLESKPIKCTVVTNNTTLITKPLMLAGQVLEMKKEDKYLGITETMSGFKKRGRRRAKVQGNGNLLRHYHARLFFTQVFPTLQCVCYIVPK